MNLQRLNVIRNAGVLLFLLGLIISTVLALDVNKSAGRLIGYLVGCSVWALFAYKLSDMRYVERFYQALFLFMLGASVYGILQYINWGIQRIDSFTSHPNIFATYLLMIIPFSTSLLLTEKTSVAKRWIAAVGSFTIIAALVLTQSRGAWLGFVVGVLLMALLKNCTRIIIISLIVLGAAILLRGPSELFYRVKSIVSTTDISITERFYGWKASLSMIADRPFAGVGLANYKYIYEAYADPRAYYDVLLHAHNIFLIFATEIGLPGTIGFICFVCAILWMGISSLKTVENTSERNLMIIALSCVVSVLTQGLSEHIFIRPIALLIFFVNLGIISLITRKAVRDDNVK